MSEISDRYRRLSQGFADKVAGVEDWSAPTPCSEWTARDLVRHVSETPGMFFGLVDREYGALPDEPVAAYDEARARMQAALDDEPTAKTEFDGFFGRSTFEDAVDRFVTFDLLAHGWDLAKATGQDTTIGEDDLARMEAAAEQFGDAAHAPGVFGPEITPPPDADRQTRLLCFLGRRP